MAWSKTIRNEHVRIGPITVLTLIIVICLAVLAVLAISTAHAADVLTQRQAESTQELYQDETAAQAFVAEVDARLSAVRGQSATANKACAAVEHDLEEIEEAAASAVDGAVTVSASIEDNDIHADIAGASGRILQVILEVQPDASYTIQTWKMSAIQNEEAPMGELWSGN